MGGELGKLRWRCLLMRGEIGKLRWGLP